MLGRFGIDEQRIGQMSLPELDLFVRRARLLQPVMPAWLPLPAPAPSAVGGKTTTLISRRRKS